MRKKIRATVARSWLAGLHPRRLQAGAWASTLLASGTHVTHNIVPPRTHAGELLTLPVDRLMTREVKTCSAEDRLVDIMEVMTLQRIRYLPVSR
jgi:CBS domain-containing protein